MDPSVYPNPTVFDARRFLRDDPTDSLKYTGLSTSMIQFGYGSWACPGKPPHLPASTKSLKKIMLSLMNGAGRFLAVTELKIAMVFFLLEFDFRLEPSQEYIRHSSGANMSNPAATIKVRRRKEKEIDLIPMLD